MSRGKCHTLLMSPFEPFIPAPEPESIQRVGVRVIPFPGLEPLMLSPVERPLRVI